MSRSAAAINPGSTNRRFVMLAVTLGLIGAVLVYVAFSRDSGTSGSLGASDTAVVVAKTDIPARATIQASMVEVVLVPADVRNALAVADPTLIVGRVTRFPIAAREQVLSTKIVESGPQAIGRSLSYIVPQDMRGFAIRTSDVQNAGGLVLPGDYVDVIVVYDVEFLNGTEKETAEAFMVRTILQNVEVLAVAQSVSDVAPESTVTAGGHRARNSEAPAEPAATTVTLALTPEQVQTMYLAEENGRVRLSVRQYGDSDEQPIEFMTENELWPRNLPNPFAP
jgi:pilus assembly protein CpaB